MKDATVAPPRDGLLACAPALDRRRVLVLALLAPAAAAGLGGCGPVTTTRATGPDPLIALADTARADAALAAAAAAANPAVSGRVEPLRVARTAHAAALDAEVVRAGGTPSSAAAARSAVPSAPPTAARAVTLARVREAVAASQKEAAALVPDLPAERVGLVASVVACCATYAEVLT